MLTLIVLIKYYSNVNIMANWRCHGIVYLSNRLTIALLVILILLSGWIAWRDSRDVFRSFYQESCDSRLRMFSVTVLSSPNKVAYKTLSSYYYDSLRYSIQV